MGIQDETISKNLRAGTEYYNEGTTIPQAASVNGTAQQTGQTNGQLEIVLEAATDILIADTENITLTIETSADGSTNFIQIGTDSITSSGAITYLAGKEIMSFVLPQSANLLEWTRAVVATDDAAATGTYDAYIRRLVH